MAQFDISIFRFVNKSLANPFFDKIMPYVTHMGSGEFVLIVVLALIVFVRTRDARLAAITLLAGVTISYYSVHFLKVYFSRPRPFKSLDGVRLLIDAAGTSFPSGHSTYVFMVATILSGYFKKYWLFFSLAAVVIFSRVYLGVHYPSDVACGAFLGSAVGYTSLSLVRSLNTDHPNSRQ